MKGRWNYIGYSDIKNMKIEQKERIVKFTCYFAVIASIIIGYLFINGKILHIYGDGINYDIPALEYIRKWLINITHKKTFWYSFAIGYGNNILEVLNWSGLGEPLMLLTALAPDNCIIYANSTIVIIKLYLSGLSMLYVLKDKPCSSKMALTLSLSYTFSHYFFVCTLCNNFATAMFTFPLIISGIEKSVDEKRISKRLILSIVYQASCGFYFLYIELLVAAFFAFIYVFIKNKTNYFESIKTLIYLLFQVMLGIGMCAPLFFSSVMGYFKCARSSIGHAEIVGDFFTNIYSLLRGLVIPERGQFALAIPIGLLTLFLASFSKKVAGIYRLFAVATILLYCSIIAGKIMNGGSYSANQRWQFVVYFWIYYMLGQIKSKEELDIPHWCYLVSGMLTLLGTILFICNGKYVVAVAWLLCFAVFYLLRNKKESICWLIAINIFISCVFFINSDGGNYLEVYGDFFGYNEKINSVRNDEIQEFDGSYRVDTYWKYDYMPDAGMYFGDYRTSEYNSFVSRSLFEFFNAYGLYSTESNGIIYRSLGGRQLLEDIFAVKYYYNESTGNIEKNDDYLPWAIVYSEAIPFSEFEKLNYIERYECISKYAVINCKDKIFDDYIKDDYDLSSYKMCIYNKCDIINSENEYISRVTINNISNSDSEIFIYIPQIVSDSEGDIYIGNKRIEDRNNIFMKVYPNENNEIDIHMSTYDYFDISDMNIYEFTIQHDINESLCYNVSVYEDGLEGYFDGKNKIICFPILYDENWKAFINDKEVPIYKMNNGLMGIITTEEINHYQLGYRYSDKLIIFIIISMACIILIGGIMIYERSKRNRQIK